MVNDLNSVNISIDLNVEPHTWLGLPVDEKMPLNSSFFFFQSYLVLEYLYPNGIHTCSSSMLQL